MRHYEARRAKALRVRPQGRTAWFRRDKRHVFTQVNDPPRLGGTSLHPPLRRVLHFASPPVRGTRLSFVTFYRLGFDFHSLVGIVGCSIDYGPPRLTPEYGQRRSLQDIGGKIRRKPYTLVSHYGRFRLHTCQPVQCALQNSFGLVLACDIFLC